MLHKLQAQLAHARGAVRLDRSTARPPARPSAHRSSANADEGASPAGRMSLSLLKELRTALDLDSGASTSTCIATAARVTQTHASLSATCAHLCALLEVHSVEALVPSARQLVLRRA